MKREKLKFESGGMRRRTGGSLSLPRWRGEVRPLRRQRTFPAPAGGGRKWSDFDPLYSISSLFGTNQQRIRSGKLPKNALAGLYGIDGSGDQCAVPSQFGPPCRREHKDRKTPISKVLLVYPAKQIVTYGTGGK